MSCVSCICPVFIDIRAIEHSAIRAGGEMTISCYQIDEIVL